MALQQRDQLTRRRRLDTLHAMRIPPARALVATCLLALAAACEKKPEPITLPSAAATLPVLVLPPNAAFVSRSGSEDALSVVFRVPGKPEQSARFYRAMLRPPGWRIVSDAVDREGAHVLYAEQDGPPLWVRIWADTVNNGTLVRLTGAARQIPADSLAKLDSMARMDSAARAPATGTTGTKP